MEEPKKIEKKEKRTQKRNQSRHLPKKKSTPIIRERIISIKY